MWHQGGSYDKLWQSLKIYDNLWTYDTVGSMQFYAYWVKFDVGKILGKVFEKVFLCNLKSCWFKIRWFWVKNGIFSKHGSKIVTTC